MASETYGVKKRKKIRKPERVKESRMMKKKKRSRTSERSLKRGEPNL